MAAAREAHHQAICCVDIAGFTDPRRNDWARQAARAGMYSALWHSFEQVRIPLRRWLPLRRWVPFSGWPLPGRKCHLEDRGDGALILIPSDIPKSRLVARLPGTLAQALARYNATAPPQADIRLRAVVEAGETTRDAHGGIVGEAVNDAFRLLDAPEFKEALDGAGAVLGLITSEWFYERVVRQDPENDHRRYRRLAVSTKNGPPTGYVRFFEAARPPEPPVPSEREPSREFSRRPLRTALVMLAVVILLVWAVVAGEAKVQQCHTPLAQVRILPSVEAETLVRSLAHDFEILYVDADGCKRADLRVASIPYAGAPAEALDQGWLQPGSDNLSSETDVWLPDSTLEVDQVREVLRLARIGTITLDSRGSIAQSPIVAAVPQDAVDRFDLDRPFDWAKAPSWIKSGLSFSRAGPQTSSVGLAATFSLYWGVLDRGESVLDEAALTDPDAAQSLHQVESGIAVQADDDPTNQLCALRDSPKESDLRSRVFLVSEKAVADYTARRMRCRAGEPSARSGQPVLLPDYPEQGTPVQDHPYVIVNRELLPRSEQRRQAIDDFFTYLMDPAAQRRIRDEGYRDTNGTGAFEDPDFALRPKELDVTGLMREKPLLEAWDKARRSAKVLFAVDVSQAMTGPFPYERQTRLAAAVEAIKQTGRRIGGRDEIGLWEFAGSRHRELLELGPVDPDRRRLGDALDALVPDRHRGSDLPRAVQAAAGRLRGSPGGDGAIKAVVVIADSADGSPGGPDATEVADWLAAGEPVRVYVLAFRPESCATSLQEITRDSGGACYRLDSVAAMARALEGITARLWGDPR